LGLVASLALAFAILSCGPIRNASSDSNTPVAAADSNKSNPNANANPQQQPGEVPESKATSANRSSWPLVLAVIYSIAIVFASLAGGWLPLMVRLTHTRLQISMSLCGGLMLGIGLFHMLPHSVAVLGSLDHSLDRAVWWMVTGLLAMFFLIRAFHFHQHEPAGIPHSETDAHVHDHEHDRGHKHAHSHAANRHPAERLSWIGVVLGLGLHTLLDGIALAASVEADGAHGDEWLLGVGTFLAILLHKPLDAMPVSILMTAGQASGRLKHIVNGAFALLCPLGVAMFFLGISHFSAHQTTIVGCALAFSAGVFVCISLSDLLPELEFHAHDRLKLSIALLVGVALAYAIGFLEPEHAHEPGAAAAHVDHDGH